MTTIPNMRQTDITRSHSHLRNWLGTMCLAAWLVAGLAGCNKDGGPVSPVNHPPGDFLVTVVPTLNSARISWTEAQDPDRTTVFYTLILEADTLLVASEERVYEASGLQFESEYTGRVIASDESGLSSKSEFSFTTELLPNQPPGAFDLTAPAGGATSQVTPLSLQWAAAVDPDGDPVSYEILLDSSTTPSTSIASGIATTSYSFAGDALVSGESYSWQVVARDGNGGETASAVARFTMQTTMILAADTPGWSARYGHSVVSFLGKIWLIGGEAYGGQHDDVWSSADGVTWQEEVAAAPWGGRTRHGCVVFDDKIWVIGGASSTYSEGESDVWSSSDGLNWTEVTPDAGFAPRFEHYVVAHDGKLWVFGGRDFDNTTGPMSVWSSVNGADWTQESDTFGYNISGRALTYDGKIWHLGGFVDSARWTTNGSEWTVATDEAAFGERIYPAVAVHDGKMWLLSGSDNQINQLSELPDIWTSVDGVTWTLLARDAGFTPVAFGQAVSHQGRLWLIGGGGGYQSSFVTDDVWVLEE